MPEASANGRNAAGPGWAPPAFLVKVAGVLVSLALTFLGLTAITFVIGRVMPVDPVLAIVGDRASDEVYQQVYLQLGLDKPIIVQYFRYLGQLFEGDLGTSIMTAQPVAEDIARFFPATLELATVATLLGVFVGVPMGVFAAVHQGRWIDHVVRVIALLAMIRYWLVDDLYQHDEYGGEMLLRLERARRFKGVKGREASFARTVQEAMMEHARQGWEYYRAETLPSVEKTGMMRKREEILNTVLVFRRELREEIAELDRENAERNETLPENVTPEDLDA